MPPTQPLLSSFIAPPKKKQTTTLTYVLEDTVLSYLIIVLHCTKIFYYSYLICIHVTALTFFLTWIFLYNKYEFYRWCLRWKRPRRSQGCFQLECRTLLCQWSFDSRWWLARHSRPRPRPPVDQPQSTGPTHPWPTWHRVLGDRSQVPER